MNKPIFELYSSQIADTLVVMYAYLSVHGHCKHVIPL